MAKNNYVVTVVVRAVYKVPIQAECIAQAEKLVRNLDTVSIHKEMSFVKIDHEVRDVETITTR